jgi:hypothetical protein
MIHQQASTEMRLWQGNVNCRRLWEGPAMVPLLGFAVFIAFEHANWPADVVQHWIRCVYDHDWIQRNALDVESRGFYHATGLKTEKNPRMGDLVFSERWRFGLRTSGFWRCVEVWVVNDVSEEAVTLLPSWSNQLRKSPWLNIAFIFLPYRMPLLSDTYKPNAGMERLAFYMILGSSLAKDTDCTASCVPYS